MSTSPVISVDGLSLAYWQAGQWLQILHEISLSVAPGEVLGLVGESGCGKSSVAYHLLGYRRANSRVLSGRIDFAGKDLLTRSRAELDELRGAGIALVPQNPSTALNPALRIGGQLDEILLKHRLAANRQAAAERRAELFRLVGLPEPDRIGRRFPHQLSGGQQQRVCIAMAVACDPSVLVLDEPTTGLDVTTQRQIIDLLRSLRQRLGTAMLYVTHDLALLSTIADRVGVMYAGHLVEVGPTADVLQKPIHPYTRGLISAIPDILTARLPVTELKGLLRREEIPAGCPLAPRCAFAVDTCSSTRQVLTPVDPLRSVACERWREAARDRRATSAPEVPRPVAAGTDKPLVSLNGLTLGYGRPGLLQKLMGGKPVTIVPGLDLAIERGEAFALVGESGSGKSTIARAISGLLAPLSGEARFEGRPLGDSIAARSPELRRRIQFVFQNPDESLNPRRRIAEILRQPVERFFRLTAAETEKRIAGALQDVSLDPNYATRYPAELSGGERQRVAIARALVADPDLLVCDEILSALDVSVQAVVLEQLRKLQRQRGLAMLFISHDLAIVRSIADRVGVLFKGELVACGPTEEVFRPPHHPYTQRLLDAIPVIGRHRN